MKEAKTKSAIGTLSERSLHRFLKNYMEPQECFQEVPVCGIIADIYRDGKIYEIQTGSVTPLVQKLIRIPEGQPVEWVLPIVYRKYICTISPKGEFLRRRKSPKTGQWSQLFYQLPRMLPAVARKNLTVRLIALDVEELRCSVPNEKVGKVWAKRLDRVPVQVREELVLHAAEDYLHILPQALPEVFTQAQLRKASGMSARAVSGALYFYKSTQLIEECGRQGREKLYRICCKTKKISNSGEVKIL